MGALGRAGAGVLANQSIRLEHKNIVTTSVLSAQPQQNAFVSLGSSDGETLLHTEPPFRRGASDGDR